MHSFQELPVKVWTTPSPATKGSQCPVVQVGQPESVSDCISWLVYRPIIAFSISLLPANMKHTSYCASHFQASSRNIVLSHSTITRLHSQWRHGIRNDKWGGTPGMLDVLISEDVLGPNSSYFQFPIHDQSHLITLYFFLLPSLSLIDRNVFVRFTNYQTWDTRSVVVSHSSMSLCRWKFDTCVRHESTILHRFRYTRNEFNRINSYKYPIWNVTY